MPRPKGSKNKRTLYLQAQVQDALEACKKAEVSLPSIMVESIKLLRCVAMASITIRGRERNRSQEELIAGMSDLMKNQLAARLFKLVQATVWLMEFTHPKLARVEHSGKDGGPIEHTHEQASEYVRSRIDRLVERRRADELISGPH